MTNQQAPEIYTLHTVLNKGERPWSGIYGVRADAEHDAKVMRDATGRDWSVVRLVVADTAATPTGPITRYEVVDCIDSKHVPAVIPNGAGPWVRYEDHVAALVEAHQHARIAELEAQLSSSGFTAADMATASAQGFRDGVASLAASAGGPWTGGEEWEALAWHLCAEENGEDACDELLWEGGPIPEPWGDRWMKYESDAKRMIELVRKFVAAPPTAQAEGWRPIKTAPKDGTPLLLRSKKGRIADGAWITATSSCGGWAWAYVNLEPIEWQPLPVEPSMDGESNELC